MLLPASDGGRNGTTETQVKPRTTDSKTRSKKRKEKKRTERDQHAAGADAETTEPAKSDDPESPYVTIHVSAECSHDNYNETEFDPGIADYFAYLDDDRPKRSQRPNPPMIASLIPPRLGFRRPGRWTDRQMEGVELNRAAQPRSCRGVGAR